MKPYKQIAIVLLTAIMMSSCWQNDYNQITTYGTVGSYVSINRENSKSFLFDYSSYNVLNMYINDNIEINLSIFNEYVTDIVYHALCQDGGAYQECIERFGDYNPNPQIVSYSRSAGGWYVSSNPPMRLMYRCTYEKICHIDIKSSQNWDAEHPAGTSLNNLFTANFESLYPYIKRGWEGEIITSIKKPTDQLKEEDLTLLRINSSKEENNPDITLSTPTRPTTGGTHTIFVTLTLDTGEQIEYSTDVTFE